MSTYKPPVVARGGALSHPSGSRAPVDPALSRREVSMEAELDAELEAAMEADDIKAAIAVMDKWYGIDRGSQSG